MSREAMEAVQDHSQVDDFIGHRVLMAIARFIPADGSEGWAPYRTLAEIAKCDKDTVGSWVSNLEAAGEISTRKVGQGRGTKIYYKLHLPFDQPSHQGVIGDNTHNNVPANQTSDGTLLEKELRDIKKLLSQQTELLSRLLSQNVPTVQTDSGTETIEPTETNNSEPTVQKPPQAEINKAKSELERYFAMKTQLPVPARATKKQKAAAAVRWWNPIVELWELCQYDTAQAKRLIDASLVKMAGLTFDSPESILKTARATYAEARRQGVQVQSGGAMNGSLNGLRGV